MGIHKFVPIPEIHSWPNPLKHFTKSAIHIYGKTLKKSRIAYDTLTIETKKIPK